MRALLQDERLVRDRVSRVGNVPQGAAPDGEMWMEVEERANENCIN